MKRAFDEELARLKHEITKMSALAETMIQDAIKVLVERNDEPAAEIREREHLVNVMQVEIDEQCLELIALHQPAARDLRFILGAGKTNAEIERLADKAIEILTCSLTAAEKPGVRPASRRRAACPQAIDEHQTGVFTWFL